MKKKKLIQEHLQALRDSCYQGFDGSWDCSTDEGKEGFNAMADSVEEVAKMLEIDLKPYVNNQEQEEEE